MVTVAGLVSRQAPSARLQAPGALSRELDVFLISRCKDSAFLRSCGVSLPTIEKHGLAPESISLHGKQYYYNSNSDSSFKRIIPIRATNTTALELCPKSVYRDPYHVASAKNVSFCEGARHEVGAAVRLGPVQKNGAQS